MSFKYQHVNVQNNSVENLISRLEVNLKKKQESKSIKCNKM